MNTDISLEDILLSSFYSLIIIVISFSLKNRESEVRQPHLTSFVIYRLISTIGFVLIHKYYYYGGDTFMYFGLGNFFTDQLKHNPSNFFDLLLSAPGKFSHFSVSSNNYNLAYLEAGDSLFMGKFLTPFVLLGNQNFMASSILFSMFCGIGLWLIFKIFSQCYPQLTTYFAWGTLYYPTISIWSSGILKDPLSLYGIGLIFYASYWLIHRKRLLISITMILFGSYLCLKLKPYILYTFIPTIFLWVYSILNKNLKKNLVSYILRPILVIIFLGGGYLIINQISEDAGKYSLNNIEKTAKGFHSWHNYLSETQKQSGYSLGEVEFTPIGILSNVPESIFVTYFRPFIGIDTYNASTYFEGIQSFIIFIITIWALIKITPWHFIRIAYKNPHVRAFMFFSLLFGFAVGFTSFNFGALSRYKIPSLPFYTASLTIIVYEWKKRKQLKKLSSKSSQLKTYVKESTAKLFDKEKIHLPDI